MNWKHLINILLSQSHLLVVCVLSVVCGLMVGIVLGLAIAFLRICVMFLSNGEIG